MANRRNTTNPLTGRIEVSNVPLETEKKLNEKVEKLGITKTAYIKNLINADLREDKGAKYNSAG